MDNFDNSKTVYGPVASWRFGQSLGIDPLFHLSTCSFNCIYCQLGPIQNITSERKVFVSTKRILEDFEKALKKKLPIDSITFSGSGEPTLALNLDEISQGIRALLPHKQQIILTNGTLLNDLKVRKALSLIDKVIVKIDVSSDESYQKVNRPHQDFLFLKLIEGIKTFKESYNGLLEVQTMFLSPSVQKALQLAKIIKEIRPHGLHLNIPKRAYPLSWHRENRGNHKGHHDHETKTLNILGIEQISKIEKTIRQELGPNILFYIQKGD